MSNGGQEAKEFYDKAILELEKYLDVESDSGRRKQAKDKIAEYRQEIQNGAFRSIQSRTDDLTKLANDLEEIIANASSAPTIGQVVADLGEFVGQVKNAASS